MNPKIVPLALVLICSLLAACDRGRVMTKDEWLAEMKRMEAEEISGYVYGGCDDAVTDWLTSNWPAPPPMPRYVTHFSYRHSYLWKKNVERCQKNTLQMFHACRAEIMNRPDWKTPTLEEYFGSWWALNAAADVCFRKKVVTTLGDKP